jgi:hypothetical protein
MTLMEGGPARVYDERIVSSPLTDEMLRPMEARFSSVRLKTPLTDDEYRQIAVFMERHPQAVLTAAHPYEQQITDLEFLRFFPFLRRFVVRFRALQSLDGLRHLSDSVEVLGILWAERQLDLSVLRRLKRVKTLELESHKKYIEVLSEMTWLEDLTLRSITLPDLSLLIPLTALLSLDIKLGGTKDLSLLPRIESLRYLELWMIKGLSDVSPIGELAELRYLFLQALKNIAALPDLSRAKHLRRVHLETMKGLRDLRPLATAPALEQLDLVDMRHLQPEDLRCLVGHPTLKGVTAGLGNNRKNAAAAALLGLPDASFPKSDEWRHL